MPDFNVHAIVLKRSQYGETDNILTLYSKERGKFSAIAKGARKAISKLSGATEVLSHVRFSLASARTLQIVRQAELINSHSHLRDDLVRLASGLYAAELLSVSVTYGDPDTEMFDLFVDALDCLSESPSPGRALRWFELQILDNLGYAPVLTECTYCGVTLVPVPNGAMALSASQGGALCPRHARAGTMEDHSALDREALILMQELSSQSVSSSPEAKRIMISGGPSDHLVDSALRRYLRFRLDRDLKSLLFLDSVRK